MSDEDEKLQKLIQAGNFGNLYAYALVEANATKETLSVTEGSWKKFDQTADPRTARRLSDSLKGYGTGWCTAGEETARGQLYSGDFYVYYSRNHEGNDTIPRIAVRMANDRVAEVRGVLPEQELEPDFYDIARQQLENLPGGESYFKKVDDMKRLTELDRLTKENSQVDLSLDDIRFLYELEYKIDGFGRDTDPRILDIVNRRNAVNDLNKILSIIETWEDDLDLSKYSSRLSKGLILPKTVEGNLDLRYLKSSEALTLPQSISGSLNLYDLESADELVLPEAISGDLFLSNLSEFKNLVLPKQVGGILFLSKLKSAQGLVMPNADVIRLEGLSSLDGLELPDDFSGVVWLPVKLKTDDFVVPKGAKIFWDIYSSR